MNNFKEAYVMLDSTRSVAQNIQHIIIRNYAQKNNLNINFYGAEFKGIEHKHFQLKDNLLNYTGDAFIFYSIYQFYDKVKGFDIGLINKVLTNEKTLHFASENIKIISKNDLENIKISLIVSHINILNREINWN